VQASQPGCSLMLLAVLSAALATQVGCVQRNLEFNCKAVVPTAPLEGANASLDTRAPEAASALVGSDSSGASEAEIEMSPTKLQFKGIAYGFREEAGAWLLASGCGPGLHSRGMRFSSAWRLLAARGSSVRQPGHLRSGR